MKHMKAISKPSLALGQDGLLKTIIETIKDVLFPS